jgi:uncharacterized repeat protein (TIGR01451 family)
VAVLACLLAWVLAAPAWAAPGTPGVPQAPRVVFAEDFENAVGPTPILLTSYTGAAGQTYSADPQWLTACNGAIVQGASPDSGQAASGCTTAATYSGVRQLAYALGAHRGSATPANNHAVTAYTQNPPPGVDRIQFQTTTPIAVPASGRFITVSVDAAEVSCFTNHALFKFYLLDGATEIPTFTTPIDPCTAPGGTMISVPPIGSAGAGTVRTGTYSANNAVLFSGSQLGIRMRNGQGSSTGNDAAFDNIQALDVTPQLDKSLSPANLGVGQTATLTFTITNTSELGAKAGWSFSDTLPAGLAVVDPAPSTTCSATNVAAPAGGGSIAVAGNLNAGQTSCTVTVNVASTGAGTYTNCAANVTTIGLDPPGCTSVTFNAADLAIVKRASSSSVVPGTEESFELVVTNNGPSAAGNVVVTDALPAELSFVSASPECAELNATVTCTIGALAPGASKTFRVTGRIASSLDHCLSNTARVASDTPDPNTADNESTICAPIRGEVDLSITKTPSTTALPIGGGQVMYTLVVENDGPSDATGVTVTDPMPAGLTLVEANPSQGSCSTTGSPVSCDLGRLAAGGSAQILVTAQTWATPGAVANTATVRGAQVETDPADNQSSTTVTVPPAPPTPPPSPPLPPHVTFDLRIDKRASAGRVMIGQRVRYEIVVTNAGSAAAPDVRLTDTLSAPVTATSVRTTVGSCTRRMPITCQLGTIAAGASATITLVGKHRELGGRQRNAASATGNGTDGRPANNLDSVDVRVRKVRLRLTKFASRTRVRAGETFDYRIRVRNPTKGEARRVRVCDRLPSGLAYVRATPGADLIRGRRCWTIGRLASGERRTFHITVRALRGAEGPKVNTATATSPNIRKVTAREHVRVEGGGVRGGGITG